MGVVRDRDTREKIKSDSRSFTHLIYLSFSAFLILYFAFSCAKKVPEVEKKEIEKRKAKQEKEVIVEKAGELSFEQAKATLVPDPYVMFGIGLKKEESGNLDEAEKFYNYAIELKPNMVEAWINLAEVKKKKGDIKGRIDTLKRASEITPNDERIWSALAIAYTEIGETQKAEETLYNAVNKIGMKKEIAKSLGYTFLKSQRYPLALFVFSELEKKYKDDPEIYFVLGYIYMKTKNCPKAISYFEKGLSLKEDVSVLNNMGLCRFEMNDIDNAEKNFSRAIELSPDFWPAYVNLGRIYKRKGMFEKSEQMYRKALEIKKDNPDIIYNLANLYETMASYYRVSTEKSLEYIRLAKEELKKYMEVAKAEEREFVEKRLNKLEKTEKELEEKLEKELKKLQKKKEQESKQQEKQKEQQQKQK